MKTVNGFIFAKKSCCSHLKSDDAPVSGKEFFDIQATTDCRFTLKGVCDMIRTHNPSQMFNRVVNTLLHFDELFHDGDPYHIETSSLIYSANQWTGFYMIGPCFMKELKVLQFMCLYACIYMYIYMHSIYYILYIYIFIYIFLLFFIILLSSDKKFQINRNTQAICRSDVNKSEGNF